jgi:hypothetical protein
MPGRRHRRPSISVMSESPTAPNILIGTPPTIVRSSPWPILCQFLAFLPGWSGQAGAASVGARRCDSQIASNSGGSALQEWLFRDRTRIRCQRVAGRDNAMPEIRPAGVRQSLSWPVDESSFLSRPTSASNNSRRSAAWRSQVGPRVAAPGWPGGAAERRGLEVAQTCRVRDVARNTASRSEWCLLMRRSRGEPRRSPASSPAGSQAAAPTAGGTPGCAREVAA